jgi:virulence-associated protein VagC
MSATARKSKIKSRPDGVLAKVFWTGRSQAVRLPKAFRLDVDEVRIHRDGATLVLEPSQERTDKNGWPLGWREIFGAGGDAPLDLGNREESPERRDPLAGRQR